MRLLGGGATVCLFPKPIIAPPHPDTVGPSKAGMLVGRRQPTLKNQLTRKKDACLGLAASRFPSPSRARLGWDGWARLHENCVQDILSRPIMPTLDPSRRLTKYNYGRRSTMRHLASRNRQITSQLLPVCLTGSSSRQTDPIPG